MRLTIVTLGFIMGAILMPTAAYAYLDPGAGSALLQGILGGIAALVVVLKLYWHRILIFLGLSKPKLEEQETENETSSSDNSNM